METPKKNLGLRKVGEAELEHAIRMENFTIQAVLGQQWRGIRIHTNYAFGCCVAYRTSPGMVRSSIQYSYVNFNPSILVASVMRGHLLHGRTNLSRFETKSV